MAQRSTFRDKAGEVAWQKQLRDQYADEPAPDIDLTLKRARVRPVSRALAKHIILKYEWLGTMGGSQLFFGLFFGDYCAGVTCVAANGTGAPGAWHAHRYGIDRRGLYTLVRGACVHWAPVGANSKLVSWTAKICSKRAGAKLMVAYSDRDAGEVGTIYQACNWNYVGFANPRKNGEIVSPKGKVANDRSIGTWAKRNGITYSEMKRLLLERGWRMQDPSQKGVYVAILDKTDRDLSKRIADMSKPYPKRGGSRDSAAPGVQPGEAGAIPSPPLHSTGESLASE